MELREPGGLTQLLVRVVSRQGRSAACSAALGFPTWMQFAQRVLIAGIDTLSRDDWQKAQQGKPKTHETDIDRLIGCLVEMEVQPEAPCRRAR